MVDTDGRRQAWAIDSLLARCSVTEIRKAALHVVLVRPANRSLAGFSVFAGFAGMPPLRFRGRLLDRTATQRREIALTILAVRRARIDGVDHGARLIDANILSADPPHARLIENAVTKALAGTAGFR